MRLFLKTALMTGLYLCLGLLWQVPAHSNDIPEDYTRYPVMVSLDTGSSASGFYFHDEQGDIYFATAGHVLFERSQDKLAQKLRGMHALLLSYPEENSSHPIFMELDLMKLLQAGEIRVHPREDAVVVRMGTTQQAGTEQKIILMPGVSRKTPGGQPASGTLLGANARMIKKFADVAVGNEIFLFGYPTSLGIENYPQIDYTRPLLRKGVVSGKNDDKKTLILDCTTHYGNSGGPVIAVEQSSLTQTRFWIIGMVVEYIPLKSTDYYGRERRVKIGRIENSGYSVVLPMDVILELVQQQPLTHESPSS